LFCKHPGGGALKHEIGAEAGCEIQSRSASRSPDTRGSVGFQQARAATAQLRAPDPCRPQSSSCLGLGSLEPRPRPRVLVPARTKTATAEGTWESGVKLEAGVPSTRRATTRGCCCPSPRPPPACPSPAFPRRKVTENKEGH
jgi:hypothetical protein